MPKRVVLVCTGNTCRSPMAEVLLRQAAQARGAEIEVTSAGLGAREGEGAAEHAVAVMQRRGLDLSAHRARRLTPELAGSADLILTMTASQKRMVLGLYPELRGKVFTLREYGRPDTGAAQAGSRLEALLAGEADARELEAAWARLAEYDIADPFGSSLETYQRCAQEIDEAVTAVLDRLLTPTGAAGAQPAVTEARADGASAEEQTQAGQGAGSDAQPAPGNESEARRP